MNKFPTQVFPSFINDYIDNLNDSLNFHKDFMSAAVMFTVASIVGNRYKLIVKTGWEATPIFWFACVGYPGTIKTHPIKTMVKPINRIDAVNKEFFDAEMAHYDPDAKPRQTKPKFKQILVSDYTIEALHMVHGINKRGLGLYKDELNGFLKDMNKYRKGSDLEFWLESFNNGDYIVNRVSKDPLTIHNICVNIIGTIQHEVLSDVISEYSGNGFIDRFLFTSPESEVFNLNDKEADPEHYDKWDRYISKLNNLCTYHDKESTETIKMNREAFVQYQQIDSEYVKVQKNDEENAAIKNYLSKMKTYVPRFALLMAIINKGHKDEYIFVSDQEMHDAGIIADYFIANAREIFTSNSSQVEIKMIANSLRSYTRNEQIQYLHNDKGFKALDLSRYFGVSRQMIYRIVKE
jgi:hypothetical protein